MTARKDQGGRVCLGQIGAAHGVRGDFRVKAFTDAAEDVGAYGPLTLDRRAPPQTLSLQIIRVVKPGVVLARAKEVTSREAAEALTNEKLWVARDALPALDDEDDYYVEDLVGLKARLPDGAPAGVVAAVHDFGAGDLLELRQIPGVKGGRLIRFTRELVPEVDIKGGQIGLSEDALDEGEGAPEPSVS
ncbi:MAG: ribosome maturation factor RimM [Pseudomonadota bacterium]